MRAGVPTRDLPVESPGHRPTARAKISAARQIADTNAVAKADRTNRAPDETHRTENNAEVIFYLRGKSLENGLKLE